MRLNRILTALALSPLLLAACASALSPAAQGDGRSVAPEPPAFEMPAAPEEEALGEAGITDQSGADAERLVIKNVRMELVVDKPDESMDRIAQMAESMDGFVVSANLYQSYLASGQEVPRASITVRVPAERLNEALARIEEESDRLPINKTIDSQDVTDEYTDQRSRLRNLEAAEAQLVEIMEEARRTEDVLNVYNQLIQVREQIEVIKGQIQYFERSAALSAISIELIANEAVQPLKIGGWEPVGIAKNAIEALISALQILANVVIWLVLFVIPILAVILAPLYLVVRGALALRSRRKGRAASPPPAAASGS